MSGKIHSIQALRAFASPVVALSHFLNIAVAFGGSAYFAAAMVNMHIPADAAVACFFTVSGFIMTMLADKGRSPADFAIRRIIRIFPPYWIVLPVMFVLPALPGAEHVISLTQLALLVPAKAHPVTWALSYEIYFYIAVTLIMLCCRGAIARGFALFAAIHVGSILLTKAGMGPNHMFLVPAAASFWVGSCVYLVTAGMKEEWPSLAVIVGAIGVLLTQTDFGHALRGNNMIFYATLFGPLFVLLIRLEKRGYFSVSPALIWWSNRSYALFLWHVPAMIVAVSIVQYFSSFSTPAGLTLFSVLSLVGAVAAALLGYRYVELPITTYLNDMLKGSAVGNASGPAIV